MDFIFFNPMVIMSYEVSLARAACFSLSWAKAFAVSRHLAAGSGSAVPDPGELPQVSSGEQQPVLPADSEASPKSSHCSDRLAMFSCSAAVLIQPVLQQLLNWLEDTSNITFSLRKRQRSGLDQKCCRQSKYLSFFSVEKLNEGKGLELVPNITKTREMYSSYGRC